MEAAVEEHRYDRMVYLQNKQPKWDEQHGGHVLNFQVNIDYSVRIYHFSHEHSVTPLSNGTRDTQGRVTESSVKNFQLCCAASEDPDQVVLQFGRVGKHKFNMDLRFPLSPMQVGQRICDGLCVHFVIVCVQI